MKLVVSFFLVICCLFSGLSPVQAGSAGSQTERSKAGTIQKTTQHLGKVSHRHHLSTHNKGLDQNNTVLVSIEDEDEDEDLAHKQGVSFRYLAAFYFAFLAAHPQESISETCSRQPFLAGSCKYIAQRVLRI